MRPGPRLLASGLVALGALGASAGAAGAVDIATVNQSTTGSALTQTGRLSRDVPTSTCAAQKPAPSVIDETESFQYRNHTLRSSLTDSVCFEVDIASSCTEISSVAYAGEFDPANPRTRYAADVGAAAGFPPYSFVLAPGSLVSVVVHEVNDTAACGDYAVTFRSVGPWASSLPVIGGRPSVGSVLTGTDAGWVGTPTVQRRWLRCDAAGAGCTDVPGATGATYTVADADLGRTLRFRNDATDADGTHGSESAFVEPFIPFASREGESLLAGDRVQSGVFIRNSIESRCGVPTSAPTILMTTSAIMYDVFPVASLLNEPVCLVARTVPACGSGVSPAIYNPVFAPASGLTANYAGNSGVSFSSEGAVSAILPAAESREVTVSLGGMGGTCPSYSVTLGADAPFASARPAVSGDPAQAGPLTAGDGTWSGTPAIARSWLRCDAGGGACVAIPDATGTSYTPTRADIGARLRLRVAATQGRSVSSDSDPSGVVADRFPPVGSVRLGSRNLRKAIGSGRVPVRVTCDEACTAVVELRVTKKLAKRLKLKRKVVIARVRGAVPAGRATTLRAKLTRRARRALRTRRSLPFNMRAALTDAAGNSSLAAGKAALKRPAKRPRRS